MGGAGDDGRKQMRAQVVMLAQIRSTDGSASFSLAEIKQKTFGLNHIDHRESVKSLKNWVRP